MRYPLGQAVRIKTTVTTFDGTPTDATTIALKVRPPTGADQDYSGGQITHPGPAGEYYVDVPADELDHWQYAWSTTGPTGVTRGGFDVVDPFAPALLTLEDAREALDREPDLDDPELQGTVDAVISWIESDDQCGAIVPRTVTDSLLVRMNRLQAKTVRVLSLTSATLGGNPVDVTDWTVDGETGLVSPGGDTITGTYVLTYEAGIDPIPAALTEAARIYCQSLWQTQRGGMSVEPAGIDDPGAYVYAAATRTGVNVPDRVQQLINPYLLRPKTRGRRR